MNKGSRIVDRILELAMRIQQIPGPTFAEHERAEFIRSSFQQIGANEIITDASGNVFSRITGKGDKPPLVVTAHMDTVFPSGTLLTCTQSDEKISGPGIGDNSLGLAALFGLYWHFTGESATHGITSLPGDLWLAADVGEEGLGDLVGMKAIADRFRNDVTAYLVLEGMSLGQIYTRGLGVRRYRIQVNTKGGHSWVDYGNPSAIHEIAELVTKLKHLTMPSEPRSSMNVGVIHGGTSVNTIAADASLELDLRSESTVVLQHMIDQVETMVKQANHSGDDAVQVKAEMIGDRPAGAIPDDHPLVQTAIECFAREGIKIKLNIGSTDANIPLSRGYPAICMGLTTGGGSHTLGEYIDIQPFSQGFKILVDLVQALFKTGTSK